MEKLEEKKIEKPSRKTWGASASLSNGEFLMRGATITAGLSGKDGRLCQSLWQREREKDWGIEKIRHM